MQKFISKKDLLSKIKELLKEFEAIGPKELPNKGIFYQPIDNPEDLYLGVGFAIESVKKFFLEPSTSLLKYRRNNEIDLEDIPQPDKKRIIIGVRPCETRGLVLLDKVFNSEYKDYFYINNRERTIIVGLACVEPDKSCFCTSMGGSPIESRGMDVQLFEAKDGFIAEIITDKGKEIFGSVGEILKEEQIKSVESEKQRYKDIIEKKIKPPEDLTETFNSDYWNEICKSCISCGICTFLCPTCHCFDLVDEQCKKLRCYDGCSFPDFTQEASGENPRPTKKERYRQRVFHKFDYFKKNFGENLCVGCGRCIRHCPVKIDIAEIAANAPITEKP